MRAFQRSWVRTTAAIWGIALLIALLSIGLAACGYSSIGVGSLSSAVSPAQVAQPQSQTSFRHCGIVNGYGALEVVPIDTGNAAQAESCFWQAFQHCQPATLIFSMNGLHASFTHIFTIKNSHGKCLILDATKFGSITNLTSPTTVYTCVGMKRYPRALHILGCGKDGTIIVLGF